MPRPLASGCPLLSCLRNIATLKNDLPALFWTTIYIFWKITWHPPEGVPHREWGFFFHVQPWTVTLGKIEKWYPTPGLA
jgi:hypothetical protein